MPNPSTVAVYYRVSSSSQSIKAQRAAVERYLNGNDLGEARVFEDIGTGADTQRRGLAALELAIFEGSVRTVVVYRLDRLSRSMRDGMELLQRWQSAGVRVVSVTQQIDLHGTIGRMMASVLLGLAECEREAIRDRQAAGITVAKAKGVYKGRAQGAISAAAAKHGGKEKARALRKKGVSAGEIAAMMGISESTVRRYWRS